MYFDGETVYNDLDSYYYGLFNKRLTDISEKNKQLFAEMAASDIYKAIDVPDNTTFKQEYNKLFKTKMEANKVLY